MRAVVTAFLAFVCLTACSSLPSDGPSATQIATKSNEQDVNRAYLLVDLSPQAVAAASQFRLNPFSQKFARPAPSPVQLVGVGDVLSVMLFEAGQGGLFTSDNGARVEMKVTVASDGDITVPYAGRIRAAGRTAAQVEAAIVRALEGKAIQPQAVVVIEQNLSNTYVVTGEVGEAGRYPLTPAGDRVLDAIARAGGTRTQGHQLRVQLIRAGRMADIPYDKLVEYPSENVYVQPDDRIIVTRDPEVYTIMGAVGQTSVVPFELKKINLLEGVARVGGLNSLSADRTGVFLFRYEAPEIARMLRPDYDGKSLGNPVPVVYRVNMGDPNAYFFAKSFMLRDKDLIYVATSPATEFQKFMQVVNSVRTGTGITREIQVINNATE